MLSDAQDQTFYVDDACRSEHAKVTDKVTGGFQSKLLTAGVRCCSMDGTTCATASNCENDKEVTFDEAVDHCKANYQNHRLCTKDELLSDICCNTGGLCDNYPVWTSTIEA